MKILKVKLLGMASISLLLVCATAAADLNCQVWTQSGAPVPMTTKMIIPMHKVIDQVIGTIVISDGGQVENLKSQFSFGNAQTRCIAGPTIGVIADNLKISLYSWNACDRMPKNLYETNAMFIGRLQLVRSDSQENFLLTCNGIY